MRILELISGIIKITLGLMSMLALAGGLVDTAIFYMFATLVFSFVMDKIVYRLKRI